MFLRLSYMKNVSWSAENPSLPRLEFGYLFPDGASVKFPMYIFKNADRVVFPLGMYSQLHVCA
jgi:hypothetical protein